MAKENTNQKMNELKVELLKQKGKRKEIKREIARLMTAATKEEKK